MAYVLSTHDPAVGVEAPPSWGDEINENFVVINQSQEIELRIDEGQDVSAAEIPSASLSTFGTSGGYDTNYPVLYYDPTTREGKIWHVRLPRKYNSGLTPVLKGLYYHVGIGQSGNNVQWGAQIAAISSGETAITGKQFDSENSTTVDAATGTNEAVEFTITLTNNNSMTAGDHIAIILFRKATYDTVTTDVGLFSLTLEWDFAE